MSRLPFELLLAFRYLRPKRTFVSVITLLSVIGVTLGVAVLIIVISVMSGFDLQLRQKILGFNAHLRVVHVSGMTTNYAAALQVITNQPHVTGAAPYVLGPVLLQSQPSSGAAQMGTPFLRGVDTNREASVSVLPSKVSYGEFNLRGNGIVVGREFAHQLDLMVGDRLSIFGPRNIKKLQSSGGKVSADEITSDEFVVRGIFDVGHYEYNANIVCVSLANAQDLYDLTNAVHGVMVMVDDPFKVEAVRRELRGKLGPEFAMRTWMEENASILNALLTEKNVMFYILFFIMIVAAFGITSVQITFVVQKTREIGVLKALGATRAQMMWLFLSQSVVVGVFGVLTGFGSGMLLLHYRNEFLDLMNRVTGFELFPASIYLFDRLPAEIIPGDIAIICGGSLVICVLAGLIPAWNAGRLDPVESLRHE